MPLPDLSTLGEASGWAIALFVCLLVIAAFIRGDIVAKGTHAREIARGDKSDDRMDKMTDAMREQTGHMRTLISLAERRHDA